jgi:peptide/nickel transport system substrate-binding protein
MIANSPHSSWKGGQLDKQLKELFVEKDESKRLEGYKTLDREILENAYILPMFQYFQPVVFTKQLSFRPHTAGYVMPSLFQRQG